MTREEMIDSIIEIFEQLGIISLIEEISHNSEDQAVPPQ